MSSEFGISCLFGAAFYNSHAIQEFLGRNGISVREIYIKLSLLAITIYFLATWLRWVILKQLLTYHGL